MHDIIVVIDLCRIVQDILVLIDFPIKLNINDLIMIINYDEHQTKYLVYRL